MNVWLVERTKKSATEDGDDSATAVDIYPESGRLAMFLSAEMPHEVMPTFGDRHAITIWYISTSLLSLNHLCGRVYLMHPVFGRYYDKNERANAIIKAKEVGKAAATAKTTVESQVEARKFITELLDGSSSTSAGKDFFLPF